MNQAQSEMNTTPAADIDSDRLTVEVPTEIRAGQVAVDVIIIVYYNCKSRRAAS
jgi:hypothetical protein